MSVLTARETARLLAVSIIVAGLTACGGGSSDPSAGSPPPPASSASPGGIWRGTDSVTGDALLGLIDEAGEFHFIRSDGVQFVGMASVSGSSIQANYEGFVPLGGMWPDGSTHGTGSLSGTLSERASISGSISFKTDGGTSTPGTLNLVYDSMYERGSSISEIAGNYTDAATGTVVTVSPGDGTIYAQNPATGCVVNGQASIIDSRYDAYRVKFTYSDCVGANSVLNGIAFSGIGAVDYSVSPVRVIAGVTGSGSGVKYAAALSLNRS